ncbi:unnamed protein product [Sphagnum jensenii]|uniref:Uncharacterized protein n=1 Tax=Sphagnum jensenii TaxID=128206 RepID=A0ABP1C1D0_9BRYO
MHTLRMIGRNCVERGTSMHFARREVEPFSCVSCFVIGLLTAIWKFFGEESEMLLLRMIGRNGVGGGTSMHFARTEVEPFSCVSCFVIGLLTAIWKEMKYREEEFSKGGCQRDLLNVAPT